MSHPIVRDFSAKQHSRDLILDCAAKLGYVNLVGPFLVGDWLELAGDGRWSADGETPAATLDSLLKRGWIDNPHTGPKVFRPTFHGVDREEAVIAKCQQHYSNVQGALWHHSELSTLLHRSPDSIRKVQIIVFDSYLDMGNESMYMGVLHEVAVFARQQARTRGRCLVSVNVGRDPRWSLDKNPEEYGAQVEKVFRRPRFDFEVVQPLVSYTSSRVPMYQLILEIRERTDD